MTEKDLKRLSRKQLLELLLKQTQRADAMEEALAKAEERLRDKTLIESEAGTMAEAALRLNGVFEACDAAAAQFLENARKAAENAESVSRVAALEAERKAGEIIAAAEKRAARREAEAERRVSECNAEYRRLYEKKRNLERVLSGNGEGTDEE